MNRSPRAQSVPGEFGRSAPWRFLTRVSGELICRLAVLRALSYKPASGISPLGTDQSSGFGGWDGHTRRTEAGAQESNEPCAVDLPRTLSACTTTWLLGGAFTPRGRLIGPLRRFWALGEERIILASALMAYLRKRTNAQRLLLSTCKAGALPTELRPHAYLRLGSPKQAKMSSRQPPGSRTALVERLLFVTRAGPGAGVAAGRSRQWCVGVKGWPWRQGPSNPVLAARPVMSSPLE